MNIEDSSSRVVLNSNSSGKAQGTIRPFKRNSDSSDSQTSNGTLLQHAAYLGDGSNAIPNFPDIQFSERLPEDCGYEDVDTLKYVEAGLFGCVLLLTQFFQGLSIENI